ncbi:MAG: SAM-dependent methyltransferase [Gammaproteobacteria bacterium]|jgi:SAM-dependent methyltransferase
MTTNSTAFVGSIPENYDRSLGPHIFAGYAADLAQRVVALTPGSVLELAAGTGIVTRCLRDALLPECHLTVTDLNSPMLEVAKAKFQADDAVSFEAADAMELPYADAKFDVIVCQFGVMFFPDKRRSYREAHRTLKPGGSYLLSIWDSLDVNTFAQITQDAVATFFPNDPPAFYEVPFGYSDPAVVRSELLSGGFDKVDIEHLPLRSSIPSADNFAQGLVFGNPLHAEIVSRGGDPQAVRAAVSTAIDQYLGSEMSMQALVVHARKDS